VLGRVGLRAPDSPHGPGTLLLDEGVLLNLLRCSRWGRISDPNRQQKKGRRN
jgi:hypothetical protein